MLKLLQRIRRDENGATAIEYGLIVALIVIAIITSMSSVANENSGLWAVVRTNVDGAMGED
jgi:pilus assembly protein Flp/PilA